MRWLPSIIMHFVIFIVGRTVCVPQNNRIQVTLMEYNILQNVIRFSDRFFFILQNIVNGILQIAEACSYRSLEYSILIQN